MIQGMNSGSSQIYTEARHKQALSVYQDRRWVSRTSQPVFHGQGVHRLRVLEAAVMAVMAAGGLRLHGGVPEAAT